MGARLSSGDSWKRAANVLAAVFLRARLHPAVVAGVAQSRPGEQWAVAFSGGADSLLLLLLVWAHWPERRKQLRALHFNHRLRGRSADADERFCREVCRGLGVRFVTGRWLDAPTKPSEAVAREARHAFFTQALRRCRTPVLWLGHHQDDVAESMLMRLARGSGAAGLSAPRPLQRLAHGRVHVRPLLSVQKRAILAALEQAGVSWREDASNAAPIHLRNRIRHDVVDVWRSAAAGRDAVAGAALSRELLAEDDEALEQWADQFAPASPSRLPLVRLRRAPRAVVRRVLHRWLALQGVAAALSRQAYSAVLDDVLRGRSTRHSAGVGTFVVLTARHAHVARLGKK